MDDIIREISEAVQRGAHLLDQRKPGWEHLIDLDTLQMNNCFRCTAGQSFENEAKARREVEDSNYTGFDYVTDYIIPAAQMTFKDSGERWEVEQKQMMYYGFDLDHGECWDELQEQWVKLIQLRRRIRFEPKVGAAV